MRRVSLSEAKMKLSKIVGSIRKTGKEVVITKNGAPAAVLIHHEEFDSWRETLSITADHGFMKEIRAGLAAQKKAKKQKMLRAADTAWYKKIKASTTPGENMRLYRQLHKLTQAQLGEKLGGLPRQHISNMETGARAISLATAKRLSAIFKVSIERFV